MSTSSSYSRLRNPQTFPYTFLEEIAQDIKTRIEARRKLADALEGATFNSFPNKSILSEVVSPHSSISIKFPQTSTAGLTIGGVDGGLAVATISGTHIVLTRVAGVMITYSSKGIFRTKYFPNRHPMIKIHHL